MNNTPKLRAFIENEELAISDMDLLAGYEAVASFGDSPTVPVLFMHGTFLPVPRWLYIFVFLPPTRGSAIRHN